MALPMPRFRFTADEYEQMIAVGILTEDDRVELIEGEIVATIPIGPRHADAVGILNRLLTRAAPSEVLVLVQSPIRLPDASEPEPDIALVRFARYRRALPGPGDTLAVIEVSDTTREYDRETKLPLYAAAGIPEVWLVDLVANWIERHTEPGAGGYLRIVRFVPGSVVASEMIPALSVPVDTVFGISD